MDMMSAAEACYQLVTRSGHIVDIILTAPVFYNANNIWGLFFQKYFQFVQFICNALGIKMKNF